MTGVVVPSRLLPSQGRSPGVKPTGNVTIDWDHPLARGLSTYVLFQDENPIDLVTGKQLTKFGGTEWRPDGQHFNEVDEHLVLADVTMNSNHSILMNLTPDDNTGSLYQYPFSFGAISTAGAINMLLFESGAANNNSFSYSYGTSGQYADLADSYPSFNGKCNAWTRAGTAAPKFYIDGSDYRELNIMQANATAMPNGTVKDLYLGARTGLNADRYYGGVIKYLAIYNDRVLSAGELDSFSADEYQFLREPF